MKSIIYNEDKLNDKDINKLTKRAKLLIYNSKDEILLTCSHNNYFLIGGHVENNESDKETLIRETLEETGINIVLGNISPFLSIVYYNKNYPKNSVNTKCITNYYYIKLDDLPNLDKTNLTKDEIDGNFTLCYISKNNILKILNDSLEVCTIKNVVRDTISAIEEFLSIYE